MIITDQKKLKNLLPDVVRIDAELYNDKEKVLEMGRENDWNAGSIVYCEELDEVCQYMLFDIDYDRKEMIESYRELLTRNSTDEEKEEYDNITNEEFVKRYETFKTDITRISETAESNNIGFYLKKIIDGLNDENITDSKRRKLLMQQRAIVDATDFYFVKNAIKINKLDSKKYNKSKSLAYKKLKEQKNFSFLPLNSSQLNILNEINPGYEEKNKLFMYYLYEYILNTKITHEVGLTIYFMLINIDGLSKSNNKMREFLTNKLIDVIKTL